MNAATDAVPAAQNGISPTPPYKSSDLGIIPVDWRVRDIGDLRPFVTSGSRGWAQYYSYLGAPFLRITNMSRASIYLDVSDLKLVDLPTGQSEADRTQLKDGDVLISITADIGIVAYVDERISKPAYVNQHIALVRFDATKTDPKFVSYLLASDAPQRVFRGLTDQGAKAGMSLFTIRKLKVLQPEIDEQREIAAALSDADALIMALDKLIAKKRGMKLGAMQQLLTGRMRLPGFRAAWERTSLKNIAPLQRGFDLPTYCVTPGPFPIVYSNGVLNHHAKWMVKGPGVVTGRSGTIGRVFFIDDDFWPHNTALWVTSFDNNNPRFVFYLYSFIGFDRFGTGSGVPTLNRNDVHAHEITYPSDPEEQGAIATNLSDMDAEIAALERRRDKTKAIKQGMMQELLTGRTRLL